MAKRKVFGVSTAFSRGLSETVTIVENNNSLFRNAIIPLSRIELDPDNPRRLFITRADVPLGPQKDDPHYKDKLIEFEILKGLANTISQQGLIQPIAVYKHDENYRVVAGNRRCLAAIIAGKNEIEARIFNNKPTRFELKLIQLIENTAREDLNLKDRLANIKAVVDEFQKDKKLEKVSPQLLTELTGFSLTQAKNYLYVLNGPEDVNQAVTLGTISSLDKAALIANIGEKELRQAAIERCKSGASLGELRKLVEQGKFLSRSKDLKVTSASAKGRITTRINMGMTSNTQVIKALVMGVVNQSQYQAYQVQFQSIKWDDYRVATQAFKKLIQLLEKLYE